MDGEQSLGTHPATTHRACSIFCAQESFHGEGDDKCANNQMGSHGREVNHLLYSLSWTLLPFNYFQSKTNGVASVTFQEVNCGDPPAMILNFPPSSWSSLHSCDLCGYCLSKKVNSRWWPFPLQIPGGGVWGLYVAAFHPHAPPGFLNQVSQLGLSHWGEI